MSADPDDRANRLPPRYGPPDDDRPPRLWTLPVSATTTRSRTVEAGDTSGGRSDERNLDGRTGQEHEAEHRDLRAYRQGACERPAGRLGDAGDRPRRRPASLGFSPRSCRGPAREPEDRGVGVMARPSKAKAIERLEKVLKEIPNLKKMERNSNEFKKWHRNVEITIANTFEDKSEYVKKFQNVRYSLIFFSTGTPKSKFQEAYVEGLDSVASMLQSMIEEIEEYWEGNEQQEKILDPSIKVSKYDNRIFVVHGRDDAAREAVARFIEQLELEPVILNEKSNQGMTIIEKFEHHSHVGFAIVLLTPDDKGSLRGGENQLKFRARQNVIFELGFFIGRLGRERVCALTRGKIEIPSDYTGVAHIPLDSEDAWKMKLVQELKAAGFDIDANRVFGSA